METKLYRSTDNKIIAGVCGGLGTYFGIDPSLVRVIMVLLALAKGIGCLVYVIAWIVIPKQQLEDEPVSTKHQSSSWNKYLPGLILIAIGIFLILRESWFWFDFAEIWPVIFIVLGLFLIFHKRRPVSDDGPEESVLSKADSQNAHNGGTVV